MIVSISDPQLQPVLSDPVEEAAGDGVVAVSLNHAQTEAVDAVEDIEDAVGGDGGGDGEDDVGAAVVCAPEDGAGVGSGSGAVGLGDAAGHKAKEYASVGEEICLARLSSHEVSLLPSYGAGGVGAGLLTETPCSYVGIGAWHCGIDNDELCQDNPEDLESPHCRGGVV